MSKNKSSPPHASVRIKAEKELCAAFLSLRTPDECRRFLRDLCTPQEITDLADRWWIAGLLDEGKHSYREIHKLTGVSVTTIGRVARFLQQENFQGYRLLLDRAKSRKDNR
jgi:TrpR-related protein YerC/YecD